MIHIPVLDRTWIVLIIGLCLILAGCGGGGGGAPAGSGSGSEVQQDMSVEPIRIGWLSSLTGPLSSAAIAENKGVQFAVEEINNSGGVLGRPLELLTRDTQGDPTKATSYAIQLVEQDKVGFIIGPVNSGESLATVPIVAKANAINIIIGTVDSLTDPDQYPRAFRVIPTNTQWIEAANDYALNKLRKTKIAVIGDNSGYGTASVEQAAEMLQAEGAEIVYTATIDPNQTDVSTDLRKARDNGAEVISVWTAATGLIARLLNARADLGWEIPFVGHPAMASKPVGDLLEDPANWENAFAVGYKTMSYDADGQLPAETERFLEKLRPVLGDNIDYTLWWVALGYDTVQVIKHGIETAGTDDLAAVQAALEETTELPGVFATYYRWGKNERDGFPTSDIVMNLANTFRNGVYQIAPDY